MNNPLKKSKRWHSQKTQSTTIESVEQPSCFYRHGEVYFTGREEPIKFTRVASRPTRLEWLQLLSESWKLKPPPLIISMIGSRADLSKRFKNTLKNGLWKAAESAGCWIISDGLDRSITKIAGEAVRDYTEAYGEDRMVIIGVAPSEGVVFEELFDTAPPANPHSNKVVIHYPEKPPDEDIDETTMSAASSIDMPYWSKRTEMCPSPEKAKFGLADQRPMKAFRLDQNHQYLIMVDPYDTEQSPARNRSLETRILFERTVLTWAKPATKSATENNNSRKTETSNPSLRSNPKTQVMKKQKEAVNLLSADESRKPRASVALPTLTDGLFENSLTRTSRLFSTTLHPPDTEVTTRTRQSSTAQITSTNTLTKLLSLDRNEQDISAGSGLSQGSSASEVMARVPICAIVAGGGLSTIEHVYASVSLNHCPMVIVRGTGGTADVLANVLDFINFKNSLEENILTEKEVNMKIASIIHETRDAQLNKKEDDAATKRHRKQFEKNLKKAQEHGDDAQKAQQPKGPTFDYEIYEDQVLKIRDLVDQYAHLLSIFDCDDSDLDGYMISALLSSAGLETPKNELNLDQLEIAIRLNRADIARTKIFVEGKRWKKGALDDFMFTVIMNDQNDFVSLLLENGFNLEQFLSVHTLERLYTECMKKTDYKTSILQQLWKHSRIYKMDWVMLRDIGKIIKNLMGDFYQPLYLSKRFRNSVVQRGLQDSSEEEEEDEKEHESNFNKEKNPDPLSPKLIEETSAMTSATTFQDEEALNSQPCLQRKQEEQEEDIVLSVPKQTQFSKRGTAQRAKLVRQETLVPKRLSSQSSGSNSRSPESETPDKGHVDENEQTPKGSSNGDSEGGSEVALLERRKTTRDTKRRPRSSTQSAEPSKSTRETSVFKPLPNGRQGVIRPITAVNLGYQPYVGFSYAPYTNDLLSSGKYKYMENGFNRSRSVGTRRVISVAQNGQLSNGETKSNSTTVNHSGSTASSTAPVKRALTVVKKDGRHNPTVHVVTIHSPTQTELEEIEHCRRSRGHAVFTDQIDNVHHDGHLPLERSASFRSSKGSDSLIDWPAVRRRSSAGARRVAHSILHPLTDPEKAQLQLKEIEREAREQKREKERRRRHRLAQGKFTVMERLTGKANEQRLGQLRPSKLANFSHTATVKFERPAREIMMMCILLGKLTMAQVFWAHEKQPIAAALLAAILFSELSDRVDDVSVKEEYEEAARSFEDRADEVLEECHQEDRLRTQLMLSRKLEYYGGTSVIRLAARGKCIRFMAHPSCQEFLSEVWMGGLSPKYTWFQFVLGMIVGMTCPIFVPQVMKYTTVTGNEQRDFDQSTNDEFQQTSEGARKSIREQAFQLRYSLSIHKTKVSQSRLRSHFTRIKEFYEAPVTRFIYNTVSYIAFLAVFSKTLLTSLPLSFSYNEMFIVIMIVSFLCEELKQALGSGCSLEEYISDGWNKLDVTAITLFLIGLGLKMQAYGQVMNTDGVLYGAQNLVTNLTNNSTTTSAPEVSSLMTLLSPHLRTATDYFIYTTQPIKSNAFLVDQTNVHFNSTPATTLLVTSTQTVPITSYVQDQQATSSSLEWSVDLPYYVITNNLFTIARIFYALSLVAFYIRLMYIFSFSMVLGPKLIMLKRMIVHDLLPFMLILMNIMVGYGVAFQAISFANGYYTIFEQDKMTPNSTYKKKRGARSLYDAVMTSYFQMLGEFRIAELQGESSKCEKKDMCPQTSARRLTIIMLSTFVLLTQVLMFNLLVATFTSTYNEIEGSSQYFWCYQRYEMIQEFVDRPSVAPPFMLIWYSVELASYLINKVFDAILGRTTEKGQEDSFCQSLQSNPTLERKLTKWEQMTGARRTRADLDKLGGRKWTGGARGDSHAVILRTGAGGGGAGGKGDGGPGRQGPGEETPGSLMKRIGPIFGPETEFIEDRFRQFNEQLEKFATIEDKLTSIGKGANRLMQVIRLISDQQFQIIEKLKPKDGRRLVGHNRKSGKNLILEAVSTAVAGLNTHCSAIEEQIEEKIRIEKQCVKAVLTRPNGEEPESDTVLQPQPAPPSRSSKGRPTTGRILERLVMSHRIWRIVPFNFEKYPGIRMNVPPNKINWKVQYTEYKTFQITEDRLAVPYPGMDDGPEVEPQKLVYNAYDSTHGVTRMSIRGRVHVMRASDEHDSDNKLIGYPLNPSGRSGLYGKGVLPHWGPNHAIVVGLTRPHPKGLVQAELPVIQVAVLNRHQNFCLPWYLTDHRADCEFHECSPNVIKALLIRRVRSIITDPEVSSLVLSGLKAANISLVYSGLLTDHLTADHAWIEAIFLNIHQNEEQPLRDELLQVFLEDDQTERALWINVCRQFGMRASHDELLLRLAEHRQAFYHETVHAEHPQ